MATIRDVAHLAGVSPSTVSHVINETRYVSDETKAEVLAAMEALNYRPNAIARSLRQKKTHTIGLIVPDSSNPFFAEVGRGVEETIFAQGYSLIIGNSEGNLEKELLHINVLTEKQVDGIMFVAAGLSTAHILTLQSHNMPLVVVDREVPGVNVDVVLTNHLQGGYVATVHLIGLGHRHIGCITGPAELPSSADRVAGYKRALIEYGIDPDEELIVRGEFDSPSGYRAVKRLLALSQPPTALFACNDLMAIGALSGAIEAGYHVPDDLSIVGFDNISLASFSIPPLTTVAQPTAQLGAMAAQMLMERIRDITLPPRRRVLPIELIVRSSSAPPPTS
jgi:LacI family transcriptional regulator